MDKVMDAPERIYVQLPSSKWIGKQWNEIPITEGMNPNWRNATNIEYTRTDAFIEKVKSFLNRKDDRDSYTIGYIKRHLKEIIKEVGL